MENIIRRRSGIGEDISQASRGVSPEAAKQRLQSEQGDLLKRLRDFFKI